MTEFIVFEGIDGSGKWTQVELVAAALRAEGKKVAILDFPRYKETSGFMVSKYLNGDYGSLKDIGAELASTFYAIDRFDAKAETVKTLEENGDILPKEAVTQRILSHI